MQGEDIDFGWLAWRDSRRSESRRSSVVSISGEDHGLPSLGKWTKVLAATRRRKFDRFEDSLFLDINSDHLRDEESSVRRSHENVHIKTGRTVGTEQVTREVVINLKETNIVCKILATRCD